MHIPDSLPSDTASHPCQGPSRIRTKILNTSDDPILSYLMISHPHWQPSRKNKTAEKFLAQFFCRFA